MNELIFAIRAIAIAALGGATDLSREDIAQAFERAADQLRHESL